MKCFPSGVVTTQLARDISTVFNGEKYGTEVSDRHILGDCLTQVSGGKGRAPVGGGAPERGNLPEGGVATLPTTSAGLDCGDRVLDLVVSWISVYMWPLFEGGTQW